MYWYSFKDKIVSYGKVKHKVWKASVGDGFYAISGIDILGIFKSAKDGMIACENYEKDPKIS